MVNDMAFPGSEGLCHREAQAGGGRHIQERIFILKALLKGWHAIPTFPCTVYMTEGQYTMVSDESAATTTI